MGIINLNAAPPSRIWLASKTLQAIDSAICADGGNAFRMWQGRVFPHMEDAYRENEDGYRSHLGASVIGGKCTRSIWYAWRWAFKRPPRGKKGEPTEHAESRMRRLWNRGHLEEARFISMLLMIGVQVYQQEADGKQYRIMNFGGHFSGSGDGILLNVPDLPAGVPCLAEFKTHSAKSFSDLCDFGVREAKPEHYAQMQEYMHHFGLLYALYMAVDKDTDALHAEILMYDRPVAEHFLERARQIIFVHTDAPPPRVRGGNPGYFQCKYLCDFTDVCYHTAQVDRNCRTCEHVRFREDGTVRCGLREIFNSPTDNYGILTKEQQLAGCEHYRVGEAFRASSS